jgi:hypothetical protein
MSRAAIQDALLADQRLIDIGLDINSVLVNYDGEQRPNDIVFLVLRYENEDYIPDVNRSIKHLTVWVHMYKKYSSDFVKIDKILDILDDILGNMVHVPGLDGYTLTLAEPEGRSRDLRDDVYETICRNASYRILSRQTEPV